MMIAAGRYRAKAARAGEWIKSPEKGTPGVRVDFLVNGEPIDWVGWLTEGAAARTAESLELMGYDGNDLATVTLREVELVVEMEEYRAKDGTMKSRPRVQWVNDPNGGGGGLVSMTAAEAQAAKDRIRGLVLAKKSQVTPAMKTEPKF